MKKSEIQDEQFAKQNQLKKAIITQPEQPVNPNVNPPAKESEVNADQPKEEISSGKNETKDEQTAEEENKTKDLTENEVEKKVKEALESENKDKTEENPADEDKGENDNKSITNKSNFAENTESEIKPELEGDLIKVYADNDLDGENEIIFYYDKTGTKSKEISEKYDSRVLWKVYLVSGKTVRVEQLFKKPEKKGQVKNAIDKKEDGETIIYLNEKKPLQYKVHFMGEQIIELEVDNNGDNIYEKKIKIAKD